jgi:hypothetical protein
MIASAFFVDQAFEATETQKIIKAFTGIRGVCPDIVMFVHFRLAQSLSEEGDCGGIWNAVHNANPDKLLREAPVIHLEIQARQPQAEGSAYAEVEKLLENVQLEKNQRLNPLAPCFLLPQANRSV